MIIIGIDKYLCDSKQLRIIRDLFDNNKKIDTYYSQGYHLSRIQLQKRGKQLIQDISQQNIQKYRYRITLRQSMSKIEERELRKSYIKHQIRQLLRKLIEVKKQKPQKSKSSSIGSFFYKHVIPGGMIDHNQQQKQIQQNNLTLEIKLSKFMGIVNRYYSQLQSKLTNLQRLLEFRNKQVLGLNNRLEEENKGRLEDVLALKTKVESLEETIDKFQQQKRYSVSFDEVYDRMNDLTCYNPKTLLKNQKVYFIDQNKLNEIHSMEKLLQGFKKYQYNVCSIVQHKDLDQQLKQLKTKQQSGRQLFEASSVLQQGQINCFKSKLSTINDGLCKQKSMHSSNQQQLLVIEQQI